MSKYSEVIDLALRKSLFYPCSEIYADHPAGFFDFGPYGQAIRRKIVEVWRRELVRKENFLEIDGAVAMPVDVFKASGHLDSFNDPITVCEKCKAIFRADNLLTEKTGKEYKEAQSLKVLNDALRKNKISCPKCKGKLSDIEKSSLMVKAIIGSGKKSDVYLRPETCQNIFLDFARLYKTMRIKLPKGIAQSGHAFRNEISPRQTLIRSIEFAQIESEVFFNPKKINDIEKWNEVKNYKIMLQRAKENKAKPVKASELVTKKIVSGKLIAYYLARTQQLFETLGLKTKNMRFRELDADERAFYAKEAFDFEVETSIGWLELVANNYRTDYDLKNHMKESKQDLSIMDEETNKKFIPHVWEISIGTNRTFYAVLENAFKKEKDRTFLSLIPRIAPLDAGVFPLLKNKPELVKLAKEVHKELLQYFDVFYDETGSVGKRYARLDEVGVPFCITIDFDSLKKKDVTIRDRDSTKQKRVKIKDLCCTLGRLIHNTPFDKI